MRTYLFLLILPLILVFPTVYGWQNTFCFFSVFGTDDQIACGALKDTVMFQAGTGIEIGLDNSTNTITISSTATPALIQVTEVELLETTIQGLAGDTFYLIYKGDWIGEVDATVTLNVDGAPVDSVSVSGTGSFTPWVLTDVYVMPEDSTVTVDVSRTAGALDSAKLIYQQWRS